MSAAEVVTTGASPDAGAVTAEASPASAPSASVKPP